MRSILFTPALQIERFERVLDSGADICLLDLEDSVAEERKRDAREMLRSYLSAPASAGTRLAVRINASDTEHIQDDLLAIRQCARVPEFIVIPKVESAQDIAAVRWMLDSFAAKIELIALIETVAGICNVKQIAATVPRVAALMFGAADYTRSLGAEICWDTLLIPRSDIVLAARLYGIRAIDTPFFDIPDIDGLHEDCLKVRKLGFNGRCVIHPSQLATINEAFSYSAAAIERARRIVEAASASGGNICKVDGQMVGAPIIEQARSVLAAAHAERSAGEKFR
ncbi:MAG: HpcH/HpaI aldolase/citrate lyase family protein [Janthinobacterium lividum]